MSRTSFSNRTKIPCPCLHLKYFTPCTVPLCLPERGGGEEGEGRGVTELKDDCGMKDDTDSRQMMTFAHYKYSMS